MKSYSVHTNLLYWSLLLLSLLLVGCSSEGGLQNFKSKPSAFGKANYIAVIADQQLWDGPIGDTLRQYFAAPYPVLPQPEPIFDLKHFTLEDFHAEPMRKELRTYLFVGNIQDEGSPVSQFMKKEIGSQQTQKALINPDYGATIGQNRWANNQLLAYIFGSNEASLMKNIRRNYPPIAKRIKQADKKQIEANTYQAGEEKEITQNLQNNLGLKIRIPGDYFIAHEEKGILWLRKETDYLSSNIIIHRLPYVNQEQLSQQGIKTIRDKLGKKYISSEIEDTYMRTNDVDLPMFTERLRLGKHYAIEARGIWDIVGDFMGGPFLSYLIHQESTGELLFVDGFIFAPGKTKRKYMQNLEHIFATIELTEKL